MRSGSNPTLIHIDTSLGVKGGPMFGVKGGPMFGVKGGPMFGVKGGPMFGVKGGPMFGVKGVPMFGVKGGPMFGVKGMTPGEHIWFVYHCLIIYHVWNQGVLPDGHIEGIHPCHV